jgi:hypothetical protein
VAKQALKRVRIVSKKAISSSTVGSRNELHKFWWLYLPILFFGLRYAVALLTNASTGLESWFRGELGIIENLTVALLAAALFCSLNMIVRYGNFLDPLLRVFLVLYSLGCIYFAGEEASWGQHWFGWETSEYFLGINSQQETNFHNTSFWLDRAPKGTVSFFIFVGGIVLPLLFYFKSWKIDYQKRFWWLLPTLVCTPTAFFATVTTWPSKIERLSGWNFYFNQSQETKEFFIAYFFLLFIVSLSIRFTRSRRIQESAPDINADNSA